MGFNWQFKSYTGGTGLKPHAMIQLEITCLTVQHSTLTVREVIRYINFMTNLATSKIQFDKSQLSWKIPKQSEASRPN